ncbi:MAG: mannose-1-phosphate guanylyltransferase [Cellvibrionaceae bacterium]
MAEQLRAINVQPSNIILEPVGRNTAPAIALAAIVQPEAILMVLPSDHIIKNISAFEKSVEAAVEQAQQGKFVAFGITPTAPETGYGYIKIGDVITGDTSKIDQFVEKPDKETAQAYLASGNYLWNSGMFMFKAYRYLEELERHNPEMLSACQKAMEASSKDLDFTRIDADAFEACPDDSIDYAVMEKTEDAVVVRMDAEWSDVGS